MHRKKCTELCPKSLARSTVTGLYSLLSSSHQEISFYNCFKKHVFFVNHTYSIPPPFRMYSKMDTIDRHIRQGNRRNGGGGSGGGSAALETLAQESFDILELLPTYIEGIKTSVNGLSQETKVHFHQNE